MYRDDKRIVVTLDAGGGSFVFGAIASNRFIIEPITEPAYADNLELCLNNMVRGFERVISILPEPPVAISFAFPGPADYPNGVIGDLPNFPAFRGGVAMGAFLRRRFSIPVFINNDGDLFAYGEALAGALPEVNERLATFGSAKRYKNLIGYTMGTGTGCGIVLDNRLLLGDNSCSGETWCMRNKLHPENILEDGVSTRAVKLNYAILSKTPNHTLEPKDIYEIAEGRRDGNRDAAIKSFEFVGEVFGDGIANALTLVDGIVVIGGGLAGANKYFMPSLINELNSTLISFGGGSFGRTPSTVYNLDDEAQFAAFAQGEEHLIDVPFSDEKITYDPIRRVGVMISKLGASEAISLGAYAYALKNI